MNRKLIFLATFFLTAFFISPAQVKKPPKEKSILTSQSWTIYKVKSGRPYAEVGEVFNFRVDDSFYYDQNNYAKRGGTFMINNKTLVLIYDSFTEERRKIPIDHKIIKLAKGNLVLKYRNRNNKNEKIYLQ